MFLGYDLMGFEMSKPYLRAELEADLKRYLGVQLFLPHFASIFREAPELLGRGL